MMKWLIPVLLLSCCTGWAMLPQDQAPAKAAVSPEQATVDEILKVYTEVFNKHDAAALAEYWAPQAVSLNTDTGTRLTGRDAIKAGFEKHFKEDANCRLSVRIKHFRFLKPDLLTLEGENTLSSPNHEPLENQFTALLVKVGDNKWNIEHAQEASIPEPETPYDGLKSLEWLVGTWKDQSEGVQVESQISWNQNKTFLIRKYMVKFADEEDADTGSQIIGWDPRSKSIRCWTFSSDGSFGEGTWSGSDKEWRVKFNHTNTDGTVLSGTQVITRLDDNTAEVEIVGQELDGVMSPSRPAVKMVKQPAAATSDATSNPR
ncbi:MAG: SgcJ/EcaC family oxidoreductase [Planctomycetia bacterium]|nr:SgcJ/EcaC family oxidoreductase [Planctomycetia bacterium]